jgi:hypothetical protein
MVKGPGSDVTESETDCSDPLPHLLAGRQVGWIFKYGEAVAIERHESESRISEDAS